MNTVASAFSIMQRTANPPTPSPALKPSGPGQPQNILETSPNPPSGALNTVTASASAAAAGNDEPLISPVAGPNRNAGTVDGLTLPSYARALRDGTGPVLQRPGLGPRNGTVGGPGQVHGQGAAAPGAMDSMNLGPGALRQNMPAAPKAKQMQYDFRYEDTDNLMNELQEFFSYGEMPALEDNERAYREDNDDIDWTQTDKARRKMYACRQLELLEHRDIRERMKAARRLSYIAEGTFAYTNGPEHQLHWVIENCKLLRECDAIPSIVHALRSAGSRHDLLAAATDVNHRSSFSAGPPTTIPQSPSGQTEIQSQIDEVCTEMGLYMGILYFIIEVFRSDDSFGDELMALDTPMPVFLLTTVASLREKTSKGYPVKKLLLLFWKTILACLGGLRDIKDAMVLQRERVGLGPSPKDFTKVSPVSLENFRKDTSIKYPTFQAPHPTTIVPTEKLAEAIRPMPLRSPYHTEMEDESRAFASRPPNPQNNQPQGGQQQPGTPAPSPPPTPLMKPKKQMYQTDPTRPFVFPFSRFDADPLRLVPFAIDEADKLYNKHMHISLGLYQLWQTRDEFIREESGLGKSGLIGFTKSLYLDDEDDEDLEDQEWDEYQIADWRYEEEENRQSSAGNNPGRNAAKKARLSLKRLYRVEVIYRALIPIGTSVVVVLLKMLLATVTSTAGQLGPQPAPGSPVPADANVETPAAEAAPPATLEEVDIMRHREIMSKSVSAIVLLLLKWMKASHAIKFQHFSTMLIDSNCLLLVLKMFGFQELLSTVAAKNEWEDHNFFRHCYLNFSREKKPGPEDEMLNPPKKNTIRTLPGGEEIELLSDYAWRNFFYAINFVRIMHQLTKQRPARIALLIQYKSTQILKRMLRVPHPMLQLQILKVIKSQVPSCGRKWRSSNMKTITAVYLNCRPDLRDDWLAATDIEGDVEASNAAEVALRSLIRFYHTQHYSKYVSLPSANPALRRSESVPGEPPQEGPSSQSASGFHFRNDSDVFPPNKTQLERRSDYSADLDGMMGAWLYEYEDLIGDLLGSGGHDGLVVPSSPSFSRPATTRNDPAWARLDAIIRGRSISDEESISDSESIVSIGELGPEARYQETRVFGDPDEHAHAFDGQDSSGQDENENTWAHISDHALSLLPKSPIERARRRSSSGSAQSPLRPVMSSSSEWLDHALQDDEEEDLGPMPVQEGTADKQERMNAPVDEVEYLESMEG